MTLEQMNWALKTVAAFRPILETGEMAALGRLLDALSAGEGPAAARAYTELFYLLRAGGHRGLGDWLHDALRDGDFPYAALAERGGSDPALEGAAEREIGLFRALAELDCGALAAAIRQAGPEGLAAAAAELPRWEAGCPFTFESLTEFYRVHGAGLFARCRAFLWEGGGLLPVAHPDCPGPEEMLGYELQRDQVEANTRALLEGKAVNNVLLYGDPGTGKSATVKSLLSLPGTEGLRLIEVQKEGMADMPRLIRALAGRKLKFILFIDDLTFDQDDKTYSAMKTILEGGLERRPDNVAIYATSNRRHLVRQTFSDRAGDEVDAVETIQEKTSLAERFGVRIPYLALNQAEFLDMVERMADLYGVKMDRQALRTGAVRWEMRHPGRTPRTARQYIASLHV